MSKRVDNKLLVGSKKSIIDFERASKKNSSTPLKENCPPKKLSAMSTTPLYNLETKILFPFDKIKNKYKFKELDFDDNLYVSEDQEEEEEFLTSQQMSRKRKSVCYTDLSGELEEFDSFSSKSIRAENDQRKCSSSTIAREQLKKLSPKRLLEKKPTKSIKKDLTRRSSVGQISRQKSETFLVPSSTPTSNNEPKTQRVLRERRPVCYTEQSEKLEDLDSFFDRSNRVKNDQKKYSSPVATKVHSKRPSPKREKLIQSSPTIVVTDDDDDDFMDDPSRIPRSKKFRVPSPTRNKYANLPEVEFLSEEEELPVQNSAEHKYCPFCKEPIPFPLPDRIRAYLINVNSSIQGKQPNRKRAPSPSVLLQRSSNVVDQFEFCRLHSGETHIVPKGLKEKYPLDIDFARLPERVEALIPELMSIIKGEVKSSYRDDALSAYKELGKARARKPTLLIQRFHTFQPGYYGPKGSSIIFSSIISHLMDTNILTPEMTRPQGTLEYIGQVLVPEAAIRLISQDRGGISLEEASEVMKDSVDFGMYVHEDD